MYSERLERAITVAMQAHAGQVRKLDPQIPYATHPVHVAFLVREAGGTEDSIIAALLHDVLEDSKVTFEELQASFGPRVSNLVLEVSEDKSLEWRARKAHLVAGLRTASAEACFIAAADKIHNLETLATAHGRHGTSVWKAFHAKPQVILRFHEGGLRGLAGSRSEEPSRSLRPCPAGSPRDPATRRADRSLREAPA